MTSEKPNSPEQPFPMDTGTACTGHDHDGNRSTTGSHIQTAFIIFGFYIAFFHARSEALITFSIIFSAIVLEAFPFMLIGALLGGLIEVFVARDTLIRLLPKNRIFSIVLAGLLGIVFPVCECAIVPVVRRLIGKGMPLGASVAFLLGGPIVNPLVFASTLVAYSFSWEVALLRVSIGFAVAVMVGLLIDAWFSRQNALIEPSGSSGCSCCGHHHPETGDNSIKSRMVSAINHGAQDFYDISKYLVIGAFIASAMQTFVPRQALVAVMEPPVNAIGLMMGLAVMLNLCSEADAFISASFQPLGIPLSAQLSFMVLGPMLDLKLILMYLTVFSKKMIITLALTTFCIVGLSMLFLEFSKWLPQ